MNAATPDLVVSVARGWLGTPYHDQASLRGVGCDCLGLARGVWRELVGAESFPIPPFSRDWGETEPHEVLAEGALHMMPEIALADAGPGTLVLFRMAPRAIAKHVGILTGPDSFIHSYERLGVIEEVLTPTWRRRIALPPSTDAVFLPVDISNLQSVPVAQEDIPAVPAMIELRLNQGRCLRFESSLDAATLTRLIRLVETS